MNAERTTPEIRLTVLATPSDRLADTRRRLVEIIHRARVQVIDRQLEQMRRDAR